MLSPRIAASIGTSTTLSLTMLVLLARAMTLMERVRTDGNYVTSRRRGVGASNRSGDAEVIELNRR
jgi:hypothetical protein